MILFPVEIILKILNYSIKKEEKDKIKYLLISKNIHFLFYNQFIKHIWKTQNPFKNIKLFEIILYYLINNNKINKLYLINIQKINNLNSIIKNFKYITFIDFNQIFTWIISKYINKKYISLAFDLSLLVFEELLINSKNIKYINIGPILFKKLELILKKKNLIHLIKNVWK